MVIDIKKCFHGWGAALETVTFTWGTNLRIKKDFRELFDTNTNTFFISK